MYIRVALDAALFDLHTVLMPPLPKLDLTRSRRTLLGSNPGGTGLGDRYFPITVMAGQLYLDGAEGLAYCDEVVADTLVERAVHRKARTEAELLAVIKESERGLPAIRVWVHEGFEGIARRLS
jgi:hypothetical protein